MMHLHEVWIEQTEWCALIHVGENGPRNLCYFCYRLLSNFNIFCKYDFNIFSVNIGLMTAF